MKFETVVPKAEIQSIKEFVSTQSDRRFYKFREATNLAATKPPIIKDRFWRALVCMRLTSQQKSGPTGPVATLSATNPFPLSLDVMQKHRKDPLSLLVTTLSAIRRMRHYNVAGLQLAKNYEWLENGNWDSIIEKCNQLRKPGSVIQERTVAQHVAENFKGIGPKQARNILQALGLTRFEIPIDSRFVGWLKNHIEFPFPITGKLLSDAGYYEFVLDAIQDVCERANVIPCMLDAAVFAEGDGDDWSIEAMQF